MKSAHGVSCTLYVVPHRIGAWMACFTYVYEGVDYDTMVAVGPLHLTEDEARAILKENKYHHEAEKRFLAEVRLTEKH